MSVFQIDSVSLYGDAIEITSLFVFWASLELVEQHENGIQDKKMVRLLVSPPSSARMWCENISMGWIMLSDPWRIKA